MLSPDRTRSRPICPNTTGVIVSLTHSGARTSAEENALDSAPAAASTAAVELASAVPAA